MYTLDIDIGSTTSICMIGKEIITSSIASARKGTF